MGDIIRIIKPGGSEKVAAAGDYVHVKTANRAFHLVFEDENYGKIEVTQGDQVRLKGELSGFRIENKDQLNALNVELIVGFGAFRAGQLVGSIDSLNSIINPVVIKRIMPHGYAGHYQIYSVTAFSATLVLPAANINGVIASNINVSSNISTVAVVAHYSAPISPLDNTVARVISRVPGGWGSHQNNEGNIFIPAGLGLYVVSNGTAMTSLDYEVL